MYELWLNGTKLPYTPSLTQQVFLTTETSVARDRSTAGAYFNGTIDEIGIWNRTLSQAEITQLYNEGAGLTYDKNPDIIVPNVTIISPSNTTYTIKQIVFNVSAIDNQAMGSCWGTIDNGISNFTMLNISANHYNYTNITTNTGSYRFKAYCKDAKDNVNGSEYKDFSVLLPPPMEIIRFITPNITNRIFYIKLDANDTIYEVPYIRMGKHLEFK
jgi:hypothetical protein